MDLTSLAAWEAFAPLHGSHAEDGGGWLGANAVIVLSTALHSLGALLWVVGTATWVVWRRALWEGHHARSVRSMADLTTAAAVLANFAGGGLRLFQPGHPGLEDLGHDAWVQLIFAKHVLLLGAVGLSAWIHLRLGPRLLEAFHAGRPSERLERLGRLVPLLLLAVIGLVGVLGAASTVTLD
jgi:hypothetical protein